MVKYHPFAGVVSGVMAPSFTGFAPMGNNVVETAEMERRRRGRRACKHGRTKAGRCRKRSR